MIITNSNWCWNYSNNEPILFLRKEQDIARIVDNQTQNRESDTIASNYNIE